MVAAAENPHVDVQAQDGVATAVCNDCEWMEIGAPAHVHRKAKKHEEEHRTAMTGTDDIPTIFDAIQGLDMQSPEVREAILKTQPEPVLTGSGGSFALPEYLTKEDFNVRDAVLEGIEERAGASDQDREAWLAERANGVTATEVAKIAKNYDRNAYDIIQEKLHGTRFNGNKYTVWGKEREPHLEKVAKDLFGIEPESRVFHAEDNPRHLASPDGIRVTNLGEVAGGEFKTCGKALTLSECEKKGYLDQCQWQMYVMGMEAVYLIWEWRLEDENGNYYAEPGGVHLVERDEDRIEYLRERANRLLADLDAAKGTFSPAEKVEPKDDWLDFLVRTYERTKAEYANAEEALRDYLDEEDIKKADYGKYSISYTLGNPRKSFDSVAFRAKYPELWAEFQKTGEAPTKPSLRVTVR